MCGRYTLIPDKNFDFEPNYNVTPGSNMPVIIKDSKNETKIMKWGYIPHWAKNTNKYILINVRSDSLLSKPGFQQPLKTQRCLIPASGFYEWSKKDKNKKIPFYFHLENQNIFSFAGIYNDNTYAIITTDSNDIVDRIHHRMPVILKKDQENIWLDQENKIETLVNLLQPYQDKGMISYPVSIEVNQPSNNNENLIKPFRYV